LSKTATSAETPPIKARFPALPFYSSIGARLLVLLLIAEIPLVVLAIGLVLQNDRLHAGDAVSRTAASQTAALAQLTEDIRAASRIAEAASAVPAAMAMGTGCDAMVRMLAKAGAGHVSDVSIYDGAVPRCSSAAALPPGTLQPWPVPPAASPAALSGRNGVLYLVHRIGADPGQVAMAVIRLMRGRDDKPPAPDLPVPCLWLQQGPTLQPLGTAADTQAEPADPGRLPLSGAPLRLTARDGRAYLYTVSALPPGIGQTGDRIVAGSDIRGAVVSAGRSFALRVLEVSAFMLSEFLLIAGGVSLVASRPLRQLNDAIDRWRTGGTFQGLGARPGPTEVAQLARSFAQATESLDQREAELRSSIGQQEVLMQEIHHRVKNNLQIIASLLNLQASRIKAPEARAEFQSARDRVRALATLHRHLYAHGELQLIDMGAFFAELCSQLFQGVDEVEGDRITLAITAPGVNMSSDQAVPIALIVTETVSNALKYAYPDGRRGRIEVALTLHDGNTVSLTVRDDGVGFDEQATTAGERGLGLQLVRGFARQLGATLTVSTDTGTCYRLDMAIEQQRTRAGANRRPGGAPDA
jgi:two-component sensor histidine kinase